MSTACAGSQTPVLCKTRRGYDKQSGNYVENVYEGSREAIYGMLNEAAGADSWRLDHDGPKHNLTVRWSDPRDGKAETPIDEVRMHANRVTKSIYDAPAFKDVPAVLKQSIRQMIQDNATTYELPTPAPADEVVAAAAALANLVLDGVEHFLVIQPVLVRVRVASSAFYWGDPYGNVLRILSNSALVSDAGLAFDLPFTLPGAFDVKTGNIVGWLKNFPEYTQAAGNKSVLSTEYEYGVWPVVLYGSLV